MNEKNGKHSYWKSVWRQFCFHRIGVFSFCVVLLFCFVAIYAPFFASSNPFFVQYNGTWFFPMFRYLFYPGFYTKKLDLFFNLMIFTVPALLLALALAKRYRKAAVIFIIGLQLLGFIYVAYGPPHDPSSNPVLNQKKQASIQHALATGNEELIRYVNSWQFQLEYMNDYEKLNHLLHYRNTKEQNSRIEEDVPPKTILSTLFATKERNVKKRIEQLKLSLKKNPEQPQIQAQLNYYLDRRKWLETESNKLRFVAMPLIRPYHWEDDAGGSQSLNSLVPWWDLTRINRKDLTAALIFGTRISLVVGIISVSIALLIGVPLGCFAGYYGGRLDILLSRMLEIWESMPVFFMLLLVVAMLQSKSIFLVMSVIGIFGWTGFSRYIRGEFFKQRNLPYVEACRAQGFSNGYVMFSHILPNAIPPLLTLLPFSIMAAITSEAGLSFLGLGEEGSCSWGVLMDEGRTAFPAESYLLWPPAILLTILLVAIALVGDALRDSIDPKLHRH